MSEVASLPGRHRTVEGLLEHLAQVAPRLKGLVVIPIWAAEDPGDAAPWISTWFTPLTIAEACVAAVAVDSHAKLLLATVSEESVEDYPPEDGAA